MVRPHGDNFGCELTEEYSPALGCPNPKTRLFVNGNFGIGTGILDPTQKLIIHPPNESIKINKKL